MPGINQPRSSRMAMLLAAEDRIAADQDGTTWVSRQRYNAGLPAGQLPASNWNHGC